MFKVGHHGSRTSTGEKFADTVHPSWGVISVATQNRYGLPDEEPIATLSKAGATVLRTDEAGTIVFTSDGDQVTRVQ